MDGGQCGRRPTPAVRRLAVECRRTARVVRPTARRCCRTAGRVYCPRRACHVASRMCRAWSSPFARAAWAVSTPASRLLDHCKRLIGGRIRIRWPRVERFVTGKTRIRGLVTSGALPSWAFVPRVPSVGPLNACDNARIAGSTAAGRCSRSHFVDSHPPIYVSFYYSCSRRELFAGF